MIVVYRWILVILSILAYFMSLTPAVLALDTECNRCHATYKGLIPEEVLDESAEQCTQCHATVTGRNTGKAGSTPYVYQTTGTDLAGGNFYYISLYGNRYGHNVSGFADIKADTINAPGLNDPSLDFTTTRLTCAGKYGCHGDRSKVSPRKAMYRTHHFDNPDQVPDGKRVATSYRFLLGVTGREMNEDGYKWEYKVTPDKHNGYQGADNWEDPKSISYLCGQCHGSDAFGISPGNFHGAAGTGGKSPWLRHPTDIPLPQGEYSAYTRYNPIIPVARLDFDKVSDPSKVDLSSGNEIVMCLSCHRAHASPYPSLLRFPYEEDMSSSGSCRTCHRKH